jgi:hypothetical protein
LSPSLSSSTATVSFSFITGIAPFFDKELESVERVGIAAAVGKIAAREQKLSRAVPSLAETAVVLLHKKPLTARGASLTRGDRRGTRPVSEATPAGGDRSRGHDHYGVTLVAQIRRLSYDVFDFFGAQRRVASDERRRSDLDYDQLFVHFHSL